MTPAAVPTRIVRLVVRPFKNRILNGGMPAGGRIPRVPGGTYGIEPRATDEALSELRRDGRLLKDLY